MLINFEIWEESDADWVRIIFAVVGKPENLQNSDSPFRFFFEDFRLCSPYNNVNYSAWHVYEILFGFSVAIFRFACSEISLSMLVEQGYMEIDGNKVHLNLHLGGDYKVSEIHVLYGFWFKIENIMT